MGLFDYFRRDKTQAAGTSAPRAEAPAPGVVFTGLDDPLLLEFIRNGASGEASGLKNMAVLRCVTLISNSLGMLPLNLIEQVTRNFSLMVRLFGNVMSGGFVIAILLGLAGLLVPIPFALAIAEAGKTPYAPAGQ